MCMYSIANHSTTVLTGPSKPWEQKFVRPQFENKDDFRRWCAAKETEHYFFTSYVPVNPGLRVSGSNPPYQMTGVVADYDANIKQTDVDSILDRCNSSYRPAWVSRTFSGGWRVVWLFEAPILVHADKLHKELLSRFKKELRLGKLLAGLDEPALYDVSKTWELGAEWKQVSQDTIPSSTLALWTFNAGDQANWAHRGEIAVPIDVVAAEVEKQFPGSWGGSFDLGLRGPRFWDSSADCSSAAIVRETGMQCFTGPKPFVSWSEILGHRFTRRFEEDKVASVTTGTWFDGRAYWTETPDHRWFSKNKDDMALELEAGHDMSTEKQKDGRASEVKKALFYIQQHNRVDVATPLVLQPEGMSMVDGKRTLNISNTRVVQPAPGKCLWGEDFPFLGRFLDRGIFCTPEQWDYFMTWFQYFYAEGLKLQVKKGQAIFIAGLTDRGKTLLSNVVIGGLMGGCMDVTSYLLGETSFNGPLFYAPVWAVDDSQPNKDAAAHARYSAMIKKMVANQSFENSTKFRDSSVVNWRGRPIITLNTDESSLQMLPDPEISILDKVCFFRMSDRVFEFPPCAGDVVRGELPFFARWLLDWHAPSHCFGTSRYHVKEYHDKSLLESAGKNGRTYEFQEIFSLWHDSYFADKDKPDWVGTSTSLLSTWLDDDRVRAHARHYKTISLGRGMSKLADDPELKSKISFGEDRKKNRVWTIKR